MSITQIDTGVVTLAPSDERPIYNPVGAGAAVLVLNLSELSGSDAVLVRHYFTFDVDGSTVIGSHAIVHGTTTDDTWEGDAGDATAKGWQSWPMAFGASGGFVSLESTSGTFDVEWAVIDLGGPTG